MATLRPTSFSYDASIPSPNPSHPSYGAHTSSFASSRENNASTNEPFHSPIDQAPFTSEEVSRVLREATSIALHKRFLSEIRSANQYTSLGNQLTREGIFLVGRGLARPYGSVDSCTFTRQGYSAWASGDRYYEKADGFRKRANQADELLSRLYPTTTSRSSIPPSYGRYQSPPPTSARWSQPRMNTTSERPSARPTEPTASSQAQSDAVFAGPFWDQPSDTSESSSLSTQPSAYVRTYRSSGEPTNTIVRNVRTTGHGRVNFASTYNFYE